jgi:hypothetical protein
MSSYSEDGGSYLPYYNERAMSLSSMDAAEESFGGADMPVGEDSTTVNVNMTYEVK